MVNFFAETFLVLLSHYIPHYPLLYYDPSMVLYVVEEGAIQELCQEDPTCEVLGPWGAFPPLALFYPLRKGPLPKTIFASRNNRYLVPYDEAFKLARFQLIKLPLAPHIPPILKKLREIPQDGKILYDLNRERWETFYASLIGDQPFDYGDESYTIQTREVFRMAQESHLNAMAVEYLTQTLESIGYSPEQLPFQLSGCPSHVNIEVTIPGTLYPEEYILVTAHYDDICFPGGSYPCDHNDLPGADDNASGAVTLLAIADGLKGVSLERSVKLVWFSGEELGLCGSLYYVNQWMLQQKGTIVGVINGDMFAYDSDGDNLFEIHAGTQADSVALGELILSQAEALGLSPELYTTGAISASDHASFWQFGIPAVEIGEDFDNDFNPYYHSSLDNWEHMAPDHAYQVSRAIFFTLQKMANPLPKGPGVIMGPAPLQGHLALELP